VEVTLSTTRPGGSAAAPELSALKVDFLSEMAAKPAAARLRSAAAETDLRRSRKAAEEPPAPVGSAPPPKKAIEAGAAVESAAFQAVFHVPGRASIESGVGARKFYILTEKAEPGLRIFSVPKKDPAAYLSARFTHMGEAPLLAGTAFLYRDGVYIGEGSLPHLVKGEERELGFGADDAVKVKRVETKRAKSETGLISASSIDARRYKITVKNLHSWPAPVTVIDQQPYSEDEKIVVTLLPETTEPTIRNREDKRGVLAWSLELKPGEEREITLAYEIRWPARREIFTSETPG
jgi:uncharacterized protein (TIGR02231 family)